MEPTPPATRPSTQMGYQRIATEEAFAPPEMLDIYRKLLAHSDVDQLAEAVRRHPTRFTGMIAVAPQDPAAAAKEIERGVTKLGMNSVIINSHTQGEYLSDSKFWDIFAAAEAHHVPIYLHPNSLPRNMIQPFQECGLDGAIYGFGVETGLHALRIITAGVFDRFPKLQMIIGHMGEALPRASSRSTSCPATTCAKTFTSPTGAWRGNPPSSSPSPSLGWTVFCTPWTTHTSTRWTRWSPWTTCR